MTWKFFIWNLWSKHEVLMKLYQILIIRYTIMCLCVMMIWRNCNAINAELIYVSRPRMVCASPSLLLVVTSPGLKEAHSSHLFVHPRGKKSSGGLRRSSCISFACRWLGPMLLLVVECRGWSSRNDNLDDGQHLCTHTHTHTHTHTPSAQTYV
jgi:hypothetical protein